MGAAPDNEPPEDLADRLESALRALWRGDGSQFEQLLDSEDSAGLRLSDLYDGALDRRAVPVVGLTHQSEVPGYQIVREIGRGGMGVVYEAEQHSPRRRVALKVLGGLFGDEQHVRLFRQETQTLARLKHPSIATIHEAGQTEEGYHFFTMELVGGAPLTEYARKAELPLRGRLELFLKICDAIQYAHDHGVIHRDLKPSNIIVDDVGDPKILDFGLARIVDPDVTLTATATRTGRIMGTLAYMSPEQARGDSDAIDPRSDVYSLGMILYELLADRLPYVFTKIMPHEALRLICEEPPTRPSTIDRSLRGDVETIVLKALEKERAQRYQSPAELGDDVRRYLDGEPIVARRPSKLYVLRKKLAKHRAATGVGLAVVLLVSVGLFFALWAERRETTAVRQAEQRETTAARQRVLRIQRDSEAGRVQAAPELARAEFDRHPELPEAYLVWMQARFRAARADGDERAVDGIVGPLAVRVEAESNPSQWAFRELLAEFYQARNNPRAADLKAQAANDVPDTAEASYLRTFATLSVNDALRYAREAVSADPRHILAWERLAYLCLLTGDFDGALAAANARVDLGHHPEEWLTFMGRVLTQRGRYAEAVEQFTRALQRTPEAPGPYEGCALARLCLKEYEQAIRDYTTAERYSPTQASQIRQCYLRATPLWITGRRAEASADYRKVLGRPGRVIYADVRLFLVLHEEGRILQVAGQEAEASKVFEQAREVLAAGRGGADHGSWLETVVDCLADQITPLELTTRADPGKPGKICEAYYYAGEVCLLNARVAEAIEWFRKCAETKLIFDPDSEPLGPMNEYHLALWRLDTLVVE